MSPDNDQKKKKNDGHTSDTSSLASSDGVDALPGSQAENENFTNGDYTKKPSKNDTLNQCRFNVGPTSETRANIK